MGDNYIDAEDFRGLVSDASNKLRGLQDNLGQLQDMYVIESEKAGAYAQRAGEMLERYEAEKRRSGELERELKLETISAVAGMASLYKQYNQLIENQGKAIRGLGKVLKDKRRVLSDFKKIVDESDTNDIGLVAETLKERKDEVDLLVIYKKKCEVFAMSPRYLKQIGYSPKDIEGRPITEIIAGTVGSPGDYFGDRGNQRKVTLLCHPNKKDKHGKRIKIPVISKTIRKLEFTKNFGSDRLIVGLVGLHFEQLPLIKKIWESIFGKSKKLTSSDVPSEES